MNIQLSADQIAHAIEFLGISGLGGVVLRNLLRAARLLIEHEDLKRRVSALEDERRDCAGKGG